MPLRLGFCTGVWENKKNLSSLSVTQREGIIVLLLSGAARGEIQGDSHNSNTHPGVARYLDPRDQAESDRRALSPRPKWCAWGGEQPVERQSRGKACHEHPTDSAQRVPAKSSGTDWSWAAELGARFLGSFPEEGATSLRGYGPRFRLAQPCRPRLHRSARVRILAMACFFRSEISGVYY